MEFFTGKYMKKNYYDAEVLNVPAIQEILAEWPAIKSELFDLMDNWHPYMYYPSYTLPSLEDDGEHKSMWEKEWKLFSITDFLWDGIENSPHSTLKDDTFNRKVKLVRRKCKTMAKVLKPYEDAGVVANGFVSRLIPGSRINPHQGWLHKVMRIHFCLKEDTQCLFFVNGEERTWREGEVFGFLDWERHWVEHNGTTDRIIMSLDFKFEYLKNYIPELENIYEDTKI